MKTALAGICWLTIAASCYLSASYLVLKGTADLRPLLGVARFVALSSLILIGVGGYPSGFWKVVPIAAGAASLWLGWSTIDRTLSGPHFEGYALVMGAIAIIQGVLTLVVFLRLQNPRIARLQH